MSKFNFSSNFARIAGFDVCIVDLRFGIENVIQPAHRSAATLKNIGYKSQRYHGENEPRHERVKRDQFAEGNPAHNDQSSALPQHEHKSQAHQHLEQGHEQAPKINQPQV